MKIAILIAAALAILASATGANAEFWEETSSCSVADHGRPRVTFEVCTTIHGMAFGHESLSVETPNGRTFVIENGVPPYAETYHIPKWTLDGKPAKVIDGPGKGSCYENRSTSFCFLLPVRVIPRPVSGSGVDPSAR